MVVCRDTFGISVSSKCMHRTVFLKQMHLVGHVDPLKFLFWQWTTTREVSRIRAVRIVTKSRQEVRSFIHAGGSKPRTNTIRFSVQTERPRWERCCMLRQSWWRQQSERKNSAVFHNNASFVLSLFSWTGCYIYGPAAVKTLAVVSNPQIFTQNCVGYKIVFLSLKICWTTAYL